jgi:hypothetical protein
MYPKEGLKLAGIKAAEIAIFAILVFVIIGDFIALVAHQISHKCYEL